jgi:hypothetical protein
VCERERERETERERVRVKLSMWTYWLYWLPVLTQSLATKWALHVCKVLYWILLFKEIFHIVRKLWKLTCRLSCNSLRNQRHGRGKRRFYHNEIISYTQEIWVEESFWLVQCLLELVEFCQCWSVFIHHLIYLIYYVQKFAGCMTTFTHTRKVRE